MIDSVPGRRASFSPSNLRALLSAEQDLRSSETGPLELLTAVAAGAVDACRVELLLFDGSRLKTVVSFSPGGDGGREAIERGPDAALGARVMKEGRPLLFADTRESRNLSSPGTPEETARSFMGVPIVGRASGSPLGVWAAYSDSPNRFTYEDLDFWQVLAWRVGWEVEGGWLGRFLSEETGALHSVRQIGHSLNNQLMVITVGVDILRGAEGISGDDRTLLEDMSAAAVIMRNLIQDLRSAAVEAAKLELGPA